MTIVRCSDPVDNMMRVPFGNGAVPVYGASTLVAHTGNSDTAHRNRVAATLTTLPPWLWGSFKRMTLRMFVFGLAKI
jgi:hypothetical protein